MKKYISLFLSVLMLLSFSQISVFAEDETQIGPLPLVGINQTQYFFENFDDFAVGTYVPAADGIQVSSNAGSNASFDITDDGMLKASLSAQYKAAKMRYDLETPVASGLLAISMIMDNSKTTGDGVWQFLLESTATSNSTPISINMFGKHANSTFRTGNTVLSPQPTDVNGLYHILITVSRVDATANWNVTAYDVGGAVPVAFYQTELAKADFPSIAAFYITSYSMIASLATAIDDFEVASYDSWKTNINYSFDFDDLDAREYGASEISSLTGIQMSTTDAAGKFEVTEDSKLRVVTETKNKQVYMTYQLPSAFKSGMITSQFKIAQSEAGSAGPWHMFAFMSGANTQSTIDLWGESPVFKTTTEMSLLATQPKLNEETQMYHLRAVAFRVDENSDWKVVIYDDSAEAPVVVYETTLSKENYPAIEKVRFINSYSTAKLITSFDDFSVKAVEIENNFASNNTTDAVLSMEIAEELITGDLAVTITDAADETKTVKATVSYDSGYLNITPESFLDYGKTYNVALSGCALSEFAFTTQNAPLKLTSKTISYQTLSGASETVPAEGTFDVVCDVNVSNPEWAQATVYMVLITYNEKGMITNITSEEVDFNQNTLTDQIKIEDVTKDQVAKTRCFVWNKTDLGYEMMD